MGNPKVRGGHTASQGLVSISQGMDFPNWIRMLSMRPPMDLKHAPKIALTTLLSINNSILGFIERMIYEKRIQAHEFKAPVFIVGHWRSGTTLLQNMFACDPQFISPSLYHVLGFHHFLMTEKIITRLTAPFLPKTRPMDNMEITWNAPLEDEAIISNLCMMSPYLMTAFHSRRSVYDRYFDLHDLNPQERARWKETITYMLKKVTLKNNKRPLLKSPTHSFRIKALLEFFPDAKFIHIVRNPYAVFPSAVHMRKRIFLENGFCKPDFTHIEDEFFRIYQFMFKRLEEDRKLLRPEQFCEVKYEDFEKDIIGGMRKIYDHCELGGWSALEEILKTKVQGLKEYKKNKFEMDPSFKRRIYEGCRSTFERYGYASEMEEIALSA